MILAFSPKKKKKKVCDLNIAEYGNASCDTICTQKTDTRKKKIAESSSYVKKTSFITFIAWHKYLVDFEKFFFTSY